MARAQPETQLQKAIVRFLGLKGIMAWVNKNGAVWDPKRQVFRAGQTVKGISDIFAISPGLSKVPRGVLIAIEVKMPRGKATPEQLAFIDNVNRKGEKAFIARSVEDVIRELDLA